MVAEGRAVSESSAAGWAEHLVSRTVTRCCLLLLLGAVCCVALCSRSYRRASRHSRSADALKDPKFLGAVLAFVCRVPARCKVQQCDVSAVVHALRGCGKGKQPGVRNAHDFVI